MAELLGPHSRVQLTIGLDLKSSAASHTDRLWYVTVEEERNGEIIPLGKTGEQKAEGVKEHVSTQLRFTTSVGVTFFFEREQHLLFTVHAGKLDKWVKINARMTLAAIFNAKDSTIKQDLSDYGALIVKAEEVASDNSTVTLHLSGQGLDKKDFFGKSDPYYVVYRYTQSGTREVAFKSEVIMKTLDPRWKPLKLSSAQLCFGDPDRRVDFEVYDWDNSTNHDLIGTFHTTLAELRAGKSEFFLINEKKQSKKDYKHSGRIQIDGFKTDTSYSFLQYIRDGVEINVVVAIDFTGSNGHPNDPNSLHYIGPVQNHYAVAISSVLRVLAPYDSDQHFPVFGFGARLPNGQVSFDFNVTMTDNPFVAGIDNVIGAYYNCLRQIELYGPTNFAPLIRKAAELASHSKANGSRKYFILLLLTDGAVTDFQDTVRAIEAACMLPLSIIIVGIGSADFGKMQQLDGDNHSISRRDIVQFAALRDVQNDPMRLAETVLAEVPQQFVDYMKTQNIVPRA